MNEENLPKDDLEKAPEEMENLSVENESVELDTPRDIEKEWADELHFDSWPPKPAEENPLFKQTPPPFNGEGSMNQQVPPAAPAPAPKPLIDPAPYVAPQSQQNSPAQSIEATEPMPNTYLVWSVLATVMCCLIPGIVAIIYSSKVSSRYYAKDYEGAKRASDMAQYWIIGSIVVGIVVQTLYLPLMIAM